MRSVSQLRRGATATVLALVMVSGCTAPGSTETESPSGAACVECLDTEPDRLHPEQFDPPASDAAPTQSGGEGEEPGSPGPATSASASAAIQGGASTCAEPVEADRPLTCASDYVYLRGVNSQGGGGSQHDPSRVPGVVETDYHWNSQEFYDFLRSRGHVIVRLDFLWERVQPILGGELDAEGVAELEAAVQRAADAGLLVLLDMKNYARYWLQDDTQVVFGDGITADDFADVWSKLAVEFADQPAVAGFGLMNEPWGLPEVPPGEPSVWEEFSQAAVDAIRSVGETRSVFVAGDEWGGAWGWPEINGEPWIDDPADNVIYEAHI